MDNFCSWLRSLFQVTVIDNCVFRLHYKVTLLILVLLSIVIGWRQHFGDPITCITIGDLPGDFVNNYCYTHSTFTLEGSRGKEIGVEVPYPGVDKYNPGDKKIFHAYYQWVALVLFLQAALFYIPRLIWKVFESGRLYDIMKGFKQCGNDVSRQGSLQLLADKVVSNLNHNGMYFAVHCVAELLNVVNVIGQIFLMNSFLGGEFSTYGLRVIGLAGGKWTEHYNPMSRVFPSVTKCTLYRYGRSGDVQKHDAMCLLNINVLNEKIYVFLWFWFVLLAVLSCVALVFEVLVLLSPKFRFNVLNVGVGRRLNHLKAVLEQCNAGDWFLVRLLSKNLSSDNFRDLVSILANTRKCRESIMLKDVACD